MGNPMSEEEQKIIDRMARNYSATNLAKSIHIPTVVSEYDDVMKRVDKLSKASKYLAKAYSNAMRKPQGNVEAMKSLRDAIETYEKEMSNIFHIVRPRLSDLVTLKHATAEEYQKKIQELNQAKINADQLVERIQNDYRFIYTEMQTELAAAAELLNRVKGAIAAGGVTLIGAKPEDEVLFKAANFR